MSGKKGGGRYTPPKRGRYRSRDKMSVRMETARWSPEEVRKNVTEFVEGAVFPMHLAVVASTDPTMPETLVAIVDERTWPEDARAEISGLMGARSLHQDEQWFDVSRYTIGWKTLAVPGGDGTFSRAFTKLILDVEAPVPFSKQFLFDLTQVGWAIDHIARGGLFAIGTFDQLAYFTSPESSYADAICMMPVFYVAARTQLPEIIKQLRAA